MSPTQSRIWDRLRARQLEGWKFRRQHPIGPYYVAFYCPAARVVIEIDQSSGEREPEQADRERRMKWLEARGYRVMRITPDEVDQSLDGVIAAIYNEVHDVAEQRKLAPPARRLRDPLKID